MLDSEKEGAPQGGSLTFRRKEFLPCNLRFHFVSPLILTSFITSIPHQIASVSLCKVRIRVMDKVHS